MRPDQLIQFTVNAIMGILVVAAASRAATETLKRITNHNAGIEEPYVPPRLTPDSRYASLIFK